MACQLIEPVKLIDVVPVRLVLEFPNCTTNPTEVLVPDVVITDGTYVYPAVVLVNELKVLYIILTDATTLGEFTNEYG
jgi:hypothetical protein